MLIIIAVVALTALKYFGISVFANMSWYWVIGLAVFAFLWFEFFERMLGLDKRKEHDRFEKIRKDRVKRTFDKSK